MIALQKHKVSFYLLKLHTCGPPCTPHSAWVQCVPVQEGGPGTWWPLDAEVVMEGGRILRTKNPTGHAVLVDCRFEIPCGKCTSSECVSVAWCTYCLSSGMTGMHPNGQKLVCVQQLSNRPLSFPCLCKMQFVVIVWFWQYVFMLSRWMFNVYTLYNNLHCTLWVSTRLYSVFCGTLPNDTYLEWSYSLRYSVCTWLNSERLVTT